MSQKERVCIMAKQQSQGAAQEVGIGEGSEWRSGMFGCWWCMFTAGAVGLSLILSACLSLRRQVRHGPLSNAHRFNYSYCMIIILLWKIFFIWIANLKQLIDYLLTTGIFADLTTKLTQCRAEGTYAFS